MFIILLSFSLSAEKDAPVVHVYDGRGDSKEIAFIDNIHSSQLVLLKVTQA